jgi:thiamine biosynthesis lipoprotein ApbE
MNRRSFLKLPILLPLIDVGPAFRSGQHHFAYESVIGTSMDLVVCSPSRRAAEGACQTVLEEVDRLRSILDTRDPASEVSRLERSNARREASPELTEVLNAYEYWERRTGGVVSIHPGGVDTPRNVDALGKAYIIDRAAAAVRHVWPSIDALLLDIGGDIVTWGRSSAIAIADQNAWYDNAQPIATIDVQNAAVATSGTYARGAHLIDARDGQSRRFSVAATAVAPDAVTANALATTLCLTSAQDGLQLVESTPGAEAMWVASGVLQRTPGFALLERPSAPRMPASTNWPAGYQVTITLPLTAARSSKRPYVVVWVDDSSGKLVRVLAIWGDKSKYFPDLSTLWDHLHGKVDQFRSVTRATRPAGKYELVWDGLDNEHKPLPLGSYRITIETNQEHGTYAKQTGTITLGDSPTSITLPATTNFDSVLVQYGPK